MALDALRIDFTRPLFDELRAHLLRPDGREDAAYLLAGVVRSPGLTRLLVREIHKVPDDVASKGGAHVTVDPDFIAGVIKRARQTESAVILTHSHPFSSGSVNFSGIDDGGEDELMPRLFQRVPNTPHAAIVFGQDCLRARAYAPGSLERAPATVRVVGEGESPEESPRRAPSAESRRPDERRARQRDYFTKDRRFDAASMRVAIVGLGGNGSHLAQQLALLGVRDFLLVDPDVVEDSNLNRLAGARSKDVGANKVDLAARMVRDLDARAEPVVGDVTHLTVARRLLECDVVFGCTDNMASRVVLNRLVHQAYVPLIDTGVELVRDPAGGIRTGIVRADVVFPDQPCLECRGLLGVDRPAANYGAGEEHAVSVVHLNAIAAALAVELFASAFLGATTRRPPGSSLQLRVLEGVLKPYPVQNVTGCTLCSEVRGLGDSIAYPCKADA